VIAAYSGNRLIALAPLMAARSRLGLFSQLEFLGTGYAGSDYLDFIVAPEYEDEAIRSIAQSLTECGLALNLNHLPPSSSAVRVADDLHRQAWSSARRHIAICPYIPLSGHTWESYLATRGASHRANFRRRFKALSERFGLRFERVTSEQQRAVALAALVRFHDERWKHRGGSTAFPSASLRAFHDDASRRALESGWLRMYVLHLEDAPAAVMYGFASNRRFYFYQHGFDDRYRPHSIGLVLMGLSIRTAIDDGELEFDMLYGDEPYKSLWASERRSLSQLHLFPSRVSGSLHHRFVEAERRLRTVVSRLRSTGEPHAA
jgi:CelD/BcsL family acetyltransferase involved in cellulose biosynthesis